MSLWKNVVVSSGCVLIYICYCAAPEHESEEAINVAIQSPNDSFMTNDLDRLKSLASSNSPQSKLILNHNLVPCLSDSLHCLCFW